MWLWEGAPRGGQEKIEETWECLWMSEMLYFGRGGGHDFYCSWRQNKSPCRLALTGPVLLSYFCGPVKTLGGDPMDETGSLLSVSSTSGKQFLADCKGQLSNSQTYPIVGCTVLQSGGAHLWRIPKRGWMTRTLKSAPASERGCICWPLSFGPALLPWFSFIWKFLW